eukprot:COSAG05_NODE_2508_length_2971_cov_1.405641_5_plen_109_part_00
MVAGGGQRRALKQAADIQRTIYETQQQAHAWDKAAEAHFKLADLRDGKVPSMSGSGDGEPDGANGDEAITTDGSGGSSPAATAAAASSPSNSPGGAAGGTREWWRRPR